MSDEAGDVQVSHHDSNGTWLIALSGEHDLATSALIEARTLAVWPRCSTAIVDLRSVSFIDSSVVNWLMRARHALESRGNSDAVRIVEDPQSNVLHPVFDALGLRDEFPCYPTVQDATAHATAHRVVPRRISRATRLHLGDRPINPGEPDAPGDMRLA